MRKLSLDVNRIAILLLHEPEFPKWEEKTIAGKAYRFEMVFETLDTGPRAVRTMIYVPCDFSGERQKDTLFPYGKYPLPKPFLLYP